MLALSSGSEDEAIAEYEERLRKLNVNRLAYERDSDVSDGEESADEENGIDICIFILLSKFRTQSIHTKV